MIRVGVSIKFVIFLNAHVDVKGDSLRAKFGRPSKILTFGSIKTELIGRDL